MLQTRELITTPIPEEIVDPTIRLLYRAEQYLDGTHLATQLSIGTTSPACAEVYDQYAADCITHAQGLFNLAVWSQYPNITLILT